MFKCKEIYSNVSIIRSSSITRRFYILIILLISYCHYSLDESEIRSPASVDSSTSCTSSNNAASTSEFVTNLPDWMTVGEHILLRKSNLSGTIAYIGPIDFASGMWIGIELDAPVGKNHKICVTNISTNLM